MHNLCKSIHKFIKILIKIFSLREKTIIHIIFDKSFENRHRPKRGTELYRWYIIRIHWNIDFTFERRPICLKTNEKKTDQSNLFTLIYNRLACIRFVLMRSNWNWIEARTKNQIQLWNRNHKILTSSWKLNKTDRQTSARINLLLSFLRTIITCIFTLALFSLFYFIIFLFVFRFCSFLVMFRSVPFCSRLCVVFSFSTSFFLLSSLFTV